MLLGVNLPLRSLPSGPVLERGKPLARSSTKLMAGAVAPTVKRNSRRENPGADVTDFLGRVIVMVPPFAVWQIYFLILPMSNPCIRYLRLALKCGPV
jgi:hypothetical protein